MTIKIDPSGLKQTNWHEYAVRLMAGGIIRVIARVIALKWVPGVGGLFLAFPAISAERVVPEVAVKGSGFVGRLV